MLLDTSQRGGSIISGFGGSIILDLGGQLAWIIHLKSVQPSEPKKQKTLPIWQPTSVDEAIDSLALLSAHCQQMIHKLESIEGPVKRNVTIASPANDLIVYDIQTALDIIVAHMNRHKEQAIRTASSFSPRSS